MMHLNKNGKTKCGSKSWRWKNINPYITDDMNLVTCKKCRYTNEVRVVYVNDTIGYNKEEKKYYIDFVIDENGQLVNCLKECNDTREANEAYIQLQELLRTQTAVGVINYERPL